MKKYTKIHKKSKLFKDQSILFIIKDGEIPKYPSYELLFLSSSAERGSSCRSRSAHKSQHLENLL